MHNIAALNPLIPPPNSGMRQPNPFRSNPLSSLPDLKLVTVPTAPVETHEKRTPLRTYLAAPGAVEIGGPAGPGAARRAITVLAPVREVEDAPEAKEPASSAPPRFGR